MCAVVVPDAISLTHLPNIISNTGMGEEVCLLLCPLSIAIRLLLMMMMVIVEVHKDEDTGQQKQHHKQWHGSV
jgi:hypothetical protein